MSEEQDESPPTGLPDWAVAVTAFGGGCFAGAFALFSGLHGGSPWPTIFLSAPASLLAGLIFGDTPEYAFAMIGGTAVLYALYAVVVKKLGPRSVVLILGFHSLFATILAFMPRP